MLMVTRPQHSKSTPPHLPTLPQIPAIVMSPDGQEYNVAGDVWILPETFGLTSTVKIDWTLLTNIVVASTLTPVMSTRAVCFAKLYISERMDAVRDSLK
jgi:hypothetical protein